MRHPYRVLAGNIIAAIEERDAGSKRLLERCHRSLAVPQGIQGDATKIVKDAKILRDGDILRRRGVHRFQNRCRAPHRFERGASFSLRNLGYAHPHQRDPLVTVSRGVGRIGRRHLPRNGQRLAVPDHRSAVIAQTPERRTPGHVAQVAVGNQQVMLHAYVLRPHGEIPLAQSRALAEGLGRLGEFGLLIVTAPDLAPERSQIEKNIGVLRELTHQGFGQGSCSASSRRVSAGSV